MKNKYLILIFALLLGFATKAQTYTVSSIPYTPYSFSTGTSIATPIDDIYTSAYPIGFTFNFFGINYDSLIIGTNGIVSFDLSQSNTYCPWPLTGSSGIPDVTLPKNSIMFCYQDINPASSVTNYISYFTTGTAPYRRFVVNYYNTPYFSCTILNFTAQMVLYETYNAIDVYTQDKPVCSAWNGGLAIQGIQDTSGTIAYSVAGRNNTSFTLHNDAVRFCQDTICPIISAPATITVNGRLYYDHNGNCVYDDTIDAPAPFQMVSDAAGTSLAMSDMNGFYELYEDTGTYIISADTSTYFHPVCPMPASYTLSLSTIPDTVHGIDFGDTVFACMHPTLDNYAYRLKACHTDNYLHVYYNNPGPTNATGLTYTLHLNDSLSITSCPYTYTPLGGNDYSIAIPSTLAGFAFNYFDIELTAGCDTVGAPYAYSGVLSGSNDCGPFSDSSYNITALLASFDPNMKQVRIAGNHSGFGDSINMDASSKLEYMIGFQNTGTSDAVNIHIYDRLPDAVIPSSIKLVGSSHPCYFRLRGHDLSIYFDHINLPDTATSEPGSHGYVMFTVNQAPGHGPGTAISNSADIYFDNNPRVTTNLALASIGATCTANIGISGNDPTCHDYANGSVSLDLSTAGAGAFVIWSNGASTPDLTTLVSGTYTATITTADACVYTKTFTITAPAAVMLTVTASQDTVCKDSSVTLHASGANTYDWGCGLTGADIVWNPAINSIFTVSGTDAHGCIGTGSVNIYVKDCKASGIDVLSDQGFDIYPNPAKNQVTIELNTVSVNASILITDLSGRVLKTQSMHDRKESINISDLPKGSYLIRVSDKDSNFRKMLIKE